MNHERDAQTAHETNFPLWFQFSIRMPTRQDIIKLSKGRHDTKTNCFDLLLITGRCISVVVVNMNKLSNYMEINTNIETIESIEVHV